MSDLKELLTIKRDRKSISDTAKYPTALDMIRCGIGSNYTGDYYDEVIEAVLDPIKNHLDNYDFELWLRAECFQKPTPEAYELAKSAWNKAINKEVTE